jgi:type I restriction enzyme S subunit
VAKIVGGGTPSTSDEENFAKHGIPWLTPADLSGYLEKYVSRGRRDISPKGLESSGAQLLPKGSVLFSSRAPIGYCVIAANEVTTNQGFKSLVLGPDLIPEFTRYYLAASKEYAESLASGTTFKELSGSRMAELQIPVPPIDVQRRIVKKLDEVLAQSRSAVEQLDLVPELAETYRQSVLAAAFRGDLTATWRNKNPTVEPASQLLERMRVARRKKWEMGELAKMKAKGKTPRDDKWKGNYVEPEAASGDDLALPAAWAVARLESLCDPARGIPYGIVQTGDATPGGVPTVRCGDIKGFDIEASALKLVKRSIDAEYPRTKLEGGEVLLAIRGSVGEVAVAGRSLIGANISREVAMIPSLSAVDPRFLMYFLKSPLAQASLFRHVKGVAQQGINLADLRTLPVPLASLEEQRALVSLIDAQLAKVTQFSARVADARQAMPTLEKALFGRAFRGELVS